MDGFMKKILCLIFLFMLNVYECQAYKYDLSICAIFKNEGPYLKEWIEYHRLIGVKHFYLFNHGSTDNYYNVLKPYIESGIVELENARTLPVFNDTQNNCYSRGLIKSRGVSQWVAFIDIDEYIIPTLDVDLAWLLSHYTDYAGVTINWRCFGTSNIKKLDPNEPMIGQLLQCSALSYHANIHVKSIVQPKMVKQFYGPHHPTYLPGYFAVDVGMEKQEGPFNYLVKLDPIRINHYWTRDEDYFNNFKKPRRISWGDSEEQIQGFLDELNAEADYTMLRYIPRLKEALKKVTR